MSATCALQGTEESAASIRTRLCPKCFLCERQGELLYESLTDRLYGAPGTWNLRRCPGVECGLVWLDPMPVEEDIGKAYLNYHTHGQGSEPVRTQIRRVGRAVKSNYLSFKYGYSCGLRRPFNFVIGLMMYLLPGVRANVNHGACHLSARRGGRLLDIGCGSGELLNGMRRLGWEAEGTDSDPKAVEIARGKSLKVHLCGTPAELQLASGTFDAVVMSHVIEHLSDPLALLRESHRLLNPGGSLVIVTPNGRSLGHRFYGANWRGLDPPRHLHVFSPQSMRVLLGEAGFRDVRLATTIRGADFYFTSSRALQQAQLPVTAAEQRWRERIWGQAMLGVEWGWLKFEDEVGEEIAVVARR